MNARCNPVLEKPVYRKITVFLKDQLKLNVSPHKSGLKHSTEAIRFLGYDITIRHSDRIVKGTVYGQHFRKRSIAALIRLNIPETKLKSYSDKLGYGNWETLEATSRPVLSHLSDAEIMLHYSAELRGFAQYYALADNFAILGKLRILWIRSYLKTMANKYKTSVQKVATMLNRGSYMAVREKVQGKTKEVKLFQLKSVKRKTAFDENVDKVPLRYMYSNGSELLRRMSANKCEYCEKEGGYFEVHHIRKLADIKEGKQPWEKLMMARKRKTLVLCVECHQKLTSGKLPDRRHLLK